MDKGNFKEAQKEVKKQFKNNKTKEEIIKELEENYEIGIKYYEDIEEEKN